VSKDFDLKVEIKVEHGGGSGIQYRSQVGLPWLRARPGDTSINLNWMMTGPQADFWYPVSPRQFVWTGQFYSENTTAGIIAWRGQVVNSVPGQAPRLIGNIADRAALGGYTRINDWNEYLIMARGGTFIHVINGQLMSVLVDDDPASSNNKPGLIGFEIEGVPCKVSIRNVWLKKLS
jgi:3-keto-disaccharide hydrolase